MANDRPTNDLITDAVFAFLGIMQRANAPTLVVPCPVIDGDLIVPPIDDLTEAIVQVWAERQPRWIGTPVIRAVFTVSYLAHVSACRHEAANDGAAMRMACRAEIIRLINVFGEISAELTRAARIN
ncbi:hypothetical protein [Nonomuraea angiospora]